MELEHPTLIQEFSFNIRLPRNLSERWMSAHENNPLTSAKLQTDIQEEESKKASPPIVFLCALVKYAETAGTVWKSLYRNCILHGAASSSLTEYLEDIVAGAQKKGARDFGFSVPQGSAEPMPEPSTLTKQRLLMEIVIPALSSFLVDCPTSYR
jgi:hypothetical protein